MTPPSSPASSATTTPSCPKSSTRSLAPQFHTLGLRGSGQKPYPARFDDAARSSYALRSRMRNSRQSYTPICRRCREEIARLGDSNTNLPISLPTTRYVGKTCHARRHHRRLSRHRPHQAARGGHTTVERIHGSLWPAAPRQTRHLRHQRTARPRRKDSGRPFQHHAGGDVQIKWIPHSPPARCRHRLQRESRRLHRSRKIITPLKDRIGSEIRTHYPATVDEGIAITAQEPGPAATAMRCTCLPIFNR